MVPILQNYNYFFSFTPKQISFNLQYEILVVCKMFHITMQLTVST